MCVCVYAHVYTCAHIHTHTPTVPIVGYYLLNLGARGMGQEAGSLCEAMAVLELTLQTRLTL